MPTTNDELAKIFKENMTPFWEQQVQNFSTQINDRITEYYKRKNRIWKDDDDFKKTLFTIAGGTLTIFASIGLGNTPTLVNIGFFFIALSMACALVTKVFAPQTLIHSDAVIDLIGIKFDENRLADLNKHVDSTKNITLSLAENSFARYKEQLIEDKKKYQKLSDKGEQLLRKLNLEVQVISDWQKYLFLIGILLIATSILIPVFDKNSTNKSNQNNTFFEYRINNQKFKH